MMQTFRKNIRWILFIALATFAGLIFFQWGLDITGTRGQTIVNIAEIDDTPVSYTEYQRYVQGKEAEHKGITHDQIWTMMVDEIMWNKLMRKEKITVSDDEIWTIIQNNPPREIYESEYMKGENGEFDFNKYQNLLMAPESRTWLTQYEYNLREELPKEKMRTLLSTLGWVTPYEDSMSIALQTTLYDISFITVPAFRLRSLLTISDEEMAEYYRTHEREFLTPESKVLKYVMLEKKPSPDDSLEAKERMEDFIIRVTEEDADFLSTAYEVSDDTIVEHYFQNANELEPAVANAFKILKDGEISRIIETPQGFEVVKRVNRGLIYLVKTNIQTSTTTVAEIRDKIASFIEAARENGFDPTAQEYNLTVRKTLPMHKDNMRFPVRNPDGLAKFLAQAKPGAISESFASFGGYCVFAFDSVIPSLTPNFDDIKPRIQMLLEREKIKSVLAQYTDGLIQQMNAGLTMEAIAAKDTLITFRNDLKQINLLRLQNEYGEAFAGSVARLEPGKVSAALLTDWAGYVIRCDNKAVGLFDSTMVATLQMKRQMRVEQIYQALFTPKEFKDNRDQFYE